MQLGEKILLLLFTAQLVCAQTPQYTLDWYYNTGSSVVDLSHADLDFDGVHEILASSLDGHLYAIALNGSLVFRYYVTCPAYSIHATDADNNNIPELLIGNCRHVEAINPQTQEFWKYNAGLKTHKITSADLDSDGDLEIIILARSTSNRETKLIAINSTGSTLWSKRYTGTPVYDFLVGDYTDSPGLEVVTGSTKLQLYDAAGDMIKNTDLKTPIKTLHSEEDVIAVGTLGGLFFFSYDGVLLNNDSSYSYIEDLTKYGDGYLIATEKLIHHTSGQKKVVAETREPFTNVQVENLDAWAGKEIIAGSNEIIILDSKGETLWEYTPYREVTDMLIQDLDGDGFKEIVAASRDHNIYFIKQTSESAKILDAEKLYDSASKKYSQNHLPQALKDIREALKITPKRKYYGLEDKIKKQINVEQTESQADEYLTDAKQLSSGPHTEKALLQASEALKLYRKINKTSKATEAKELLRWLSVETKTTTTSTTAEKEPIKAAGNYLLPAVIILLLIMISIAAVLRHGIHIKQ
ncbi:MAG: hypothetical protein GF334_03520 [Candidatus Altiarchaeales archaeon]|nr:hypothetical protein [Candidatus Altiarchaeales archaeon]